MIQIDQPVDYVCSQCNQQKSARGIITSTLPLEPLLVYCSEECLQLAVKNNKE